MNIAWEYRIDEFLQYVSGFEPSFRAKIRGAAPSEIAILESLSPIPLPDYYKDFLLQMGRNVGGLRLPLDADWDIDNLIEYYRERNPLPPGYIAIAVNGAGHCAWEICLRLPSGCVIATEAPIVCYQLSESLGKLLFRTVFETHELSRHPSVRRLSARDAADDKLRAMAALAQQLAFERGFTRRWFSDEHVYCGEQEGAALLIRQWGFHGRVSSIHIELHASTEEQVQELGSVFTGAMELRPD